MRLCRGTFLGTGHWLLAHSFGSCALDIGLLGTLPGNTPEATMASALYTDIRRPDSLFVR